MDNEKYERYISVEQSILGSLKEIREMRAGRLPEPTLENFFAEIDALIEEEKANAGNTNKAFQRRHQVLRPKKKVFKNTR
ncbi:MAG: hypothetical protein IJS69_06165 [Selenomonadaceae bacterium]|nr:hypothetical protein [Selenomonadaceae bacterium]